MEAVAPEQRTLMSGANELANGLGFAIIGLGGGYIITAFGYRPLFLLSACLTAVGTLVFWWCCAEGTAAGGVDTSVNNEDTMNSGAPTTPVLPPVQWLEGRAGTPISPQSRGRPRNLGGLRLSLSRPNASL